MKISQQNSGNLSNMQSHSQLRTPLSKGNIIQKPLRTECSPKNLQNNSFNLNNTQPYAMGTKRYSIEPTSTSHAAVSHRLTQINKRNTMTPLSNNNNNYKNNYNQKENMNCTTQFSNSLTQNNNIKGPQGYHNQNIKGMQLNHSQHSILNTSGSSLYSSNVQTHQFEQKLIQQQQNISQYGSPPQLTIQPIDFLDISKGDLQLSQVFSPTTQAIITSSGSSQSKERIQSQKTLSKINCKNHNTVQASFYGIENRIVSYFCTTCSISMIKKGLKLHEIVNSQLSQKRPLQQINLNFNQNPQQQQQQQQHQSGVSTPMKLSLGQHKMINLSNVQLIQSEIQKTKHKTNTNSPSTSIFTPRQQSTTFPVAVFEPFSNQSAHQQNPNQQQPAQQHHYQQKQQQQIIAGQNSNQNSKSNMNGEEEVEGLEQILALHKIKKSELQGGKGKVKEYLEELMSKMEKIKKMCNEKQERVQSKKQELDEVYELQKQIVLQKILESIRQLEEEKQRSILSIDVQKQESVVQLSAIEYTLHSCLKDIHNITSDIRDNISNIFSNLDLKPFKTIYNKYNAKLDSFIHNINHIDNSTIRYSLLNHNSISLYQTLLQDQSKKAFQLDQKQDLLSLNLLTQIQALYPQVFNNNNNSKESFIQNNHEIKGSQFPLQLPNLINEFNQTQHHNHQNDLILNKSQEDTPKHVSRVSQNNIAQENNLIQQNNAGSNRKSSRDNQVYVSFNNKNIFQNDLNSQIETLNDEQIQESIPIKISQTEDKTTNIHPKEQVKHKILPITKEKSDESQNNFFTIKEEDDSNNNNNNTSLLIRLVDSQIQNLVKSAEDNKSNITNNIDQAASIFQQEWSQQSKNMSSKESMESNLDQYKQNGLAKQQSPSRNSLNSQTGKGRNACKSPNSLKYMELLDKINTNQVNTNMFYQTLIKENQMLQSSSDTNSQKQSMCATNTFTVQLQKQQGGNDSNKSSTQYSSKIQNLIPEGNSQQLSMNIQTSQIICSDVIQPSQLQKLSSSTNLQDIGSVSPISLTPSYYISSLSANSANPTTKPLPSPRICKTITLHTQEGNQQQQQQQQQQSTHNYQKRLF